MPTELWTAPTCPAALLACRLPACMPVVADCPPPLCALCCAVWCRERDRLYERAEKVGALLANLGEQLKEAIADVNESTGGQGGPASQV